MLKDVIVKPMSEDFILWRCLHGGPLSHENIDRWPTDNPLPWERYRQRNPPILLKLTRTYGACAMIAVDHNQIVGQLRFYPRVIWDVKSLDGFCMQQDFPAGPADNFAERNFPLFDQINDKTICIHCLMTGSSQQQINPYQRKGIGTRLAKALIQWALDRGWQGIETDAFEELPLIYEITGSAGYRFWEKLGFNMIERYPHPYLQEQSDFVNTLEAQAKSLGISPEKARERIVMRLDL